MSNFRHLRQFKPEELLFNEDETRIVLKFIFAPTDHELIDSLPMSDALREFAQGLLVEAIDASYAVGFVKAIQESAANPTKGAREILKSFAKKAAIHWFKARYRYRSDECQGVPIRVGRLGRTLPQPFACVRLRRAS